MEQGPDMSEAHTAVERGLGRSVAGTAGDLDQGKLVARMAVEQGQDMLVPCTAGELEPGK